MPRHTCIIRICKHARINHKHAETARESAAHCATLTAASPSNIRTVMNHLAEKRTELVQTIEQQSPATERKIRHATNLCCIGLQLACLSWAPVAMAQAPIRDRSDAVAPIEGARRAADAARNALVAAENRQAAAISRRKQAEEAMAAAQKEIEAARIEESGAGAELARSRQADEKARAALSRVLDVGK